MNLEDHSLDLISGDWLRGDLEPDRDYDGYDVVYEGLVQSSWSGGLTWSASRKVMEAVIEDQKRLYGDDEPGAPILYWAGDCVVLIDIDGEAYVTAPDDSGRYLVDFGWSWGRVESDEDWLKVIKDDGDEQRPKSYRPTLLDPSNTEEYLTAAWQLNENLPDMIPDIKTVADADELLFELRDHLEALVAARGATAAEGD